MHLNLALLHTALTRWLLQGGGGNSMLMDSSDAAAAAVAMNMMDEDRVGVFGGRSKRRR